MSTNPTEPPKGRIRQIRQAYKVTKKSDTNIGLVLLLWFLVFAGIAGFASWFLLKSFNPIVGIVSAVLTGILVGLLATLTVFGRRAERAAYAQVEGQVGAAAGALQMLKRGWNVKQTIAFTKNQDVVHRVLGRPGIILVGEGNPGRVRNLLNNEKKKHARIAGENVPVIEIIVGNGEGQVKLTKLIRHVRKLPKNIKPAEMTRIIQRLKALDAMRPTAPTPRGPLPTNMKGSRKMMQGK